jgi:hypothetical protein
VWNGEHFFVKFFFQETFTVGTTRIVLQNRFSDLVSFCRTTEDIELDSESTWFTKCC